MPDFRLPIADWGSDGTVSPFAPPTRQFLFSSFYFRVSQRFFQPAEGLPYPAIALFGRLERLLGLAEEERPD